MWAELPLDVLTHLFSFLPPNSLANALCTCKHWHAMALLLPSHHRHPPWLLAMPNNSHHSNFCHVRDPQLQKWYSLPLDFIQNPVRLVCYLGHGLLLCRLVTSSSSLRLIICNPFTRQSRALPELLSSRSNPAIGVVLALTGNAAVVAHYVIIVAGGASGGTYRSTLEMYDLRKEGEGWRLVGSMPIEFAIRLTIWTPHDSVHTGDGFLYWITSARAYTIMRLELARWEWTEVKLPMADRLTWAAMFRRKNGRVGLMGGSPETVIGQVWELDSTTMDDEWRTVSTVPVDLAERFGNGGGGVIKCAGAGSAVYLYRELGSEMLEWSEFEGKGWNLVEGIGSNLGSNVPLFMAASIYPSLAHSFF